jgi:Mce-associated membrane protein
MSRLATIRRHALTLQDALVAVIVILAVATAALSWQSHSLRSDDALKNHSMLDQRVQEGVTTVVSRGLTQVLSYDYNQPDATRAFADQVLSGQARKEYDTLFASLQERAPGQKLTLSAEVRVSGVKELTSSKATMLVFIDQRSTRAADKQSSVSAAQLSVTAERKGNSWVITGLKPL